MKEQEGAMPNCAHVMCDEYLICVPQPSKAKPTVVHSSANSSSF